MTSHDRTNQFGQSTRIHQEEALGEMHRRIDMSASMLGRAITVGLVEITLRRLALEFGFQDEILGRGPIESLGRKIVAQVNPLASPKWRLCRRAGTGWNQQQKKTQESDKRCFHVSKIVNLWTKDKLGETGGSQWSPKS